jgi:hypothetical protein
MLDVLGNKRVAHGFYGGDTAITNVATIKGKLSLYDVINRAFLAPVAVVISCGLRGVDMGLRVEPAMT